jgi:hypothetical protein
MQVVQTVLALVAQFSVYALLLYFLFTWAEAFKDYWNLAAGSPLQRAKNSLLASVDAPVHAYMHMLRSNLRASLGAVMLMAVGAVAQIAPPQATLGASFAFFIITAWVVPGLVRFMGAAAARRAQAQKNNN